MNKNGVKFQIRTIFAYFTTMTNDINYQQGRMIKDPKTMLPNERVVWQQQCAQHARNYLFSIGQPLVYRRADGHTVAEYADGSIVLVR